MPRIRRQIDIKVEQEECLQCLAGALKIDEEELIWQAIDLDVWKQEMVFVMERRVGAIVRQARSWRRQGLMQGKV